MKSRWRSAVGLAASLMVVASASANAGTVHYDSFGPGYGLADYQAKWSNPYGPGELAAGGTRDFQHGTFNVRATPFRTGSDYSVYDHLKYIGISNSVFPVPGGGSVTFASTIRADTPGTKNGMKQQGVYGPSGSWTDPSLKPAGFAPYEATVLEGQQAGAVMNMVDFCTGQLFDWFVAGKTAFALIERQPTNVTGNTSNPNCPDAGYVGRNKMYTQIIREVNIAHNVPQRVAITYSDNGTADYSLNGKVVAHVDHVGVPLDKQGVPYTGTYPSLGPGEPLAGQLHSLAIGHGLFSLIDAFPFQHPEAPELDVSIPVGTSNPKDRGRARLFGQGADASFDDFDVTTTP
jgi:hypothetical protein